MQNTLILMFIKILLNLLEIKISIPKELHLKWLCYRIDQQTIHQLHLLLIWVKNNRKVRMTEMFTVLICLV